MKDQKIDKLERYVERVEEAFKVGEELTLNEDLESVDGELAVDEYGCDDEPLYGY